MDNKYRKFYVEWWQIRKSTVFALVAIIVIGCGLVFGIRYASQNNWFIPDATTDIPKDAARIISFEGEVRIIRAATRETVVVNKPTYVLAGDTIQTMSDGRAIVQNIDKSTYQVRPNSVMIVKVTTTILGSRDVRVSLEDGQLNVRTNDQPQDTKNIVEVANTENRLQSNTDASFNADSQNNTGEIRISRGGIETTIAGEKTTISENEFASVNGGKLTAREKLLAPPRALLPDNSAQIVDSGGGVSVGFSWQDADGNPASTYYLQISKSPTFAPDAIMVDRGGMTTREYRLASLNPGIYYWRLRSTSKSGQTTIWNDAWKFRVVRPGDSVTIDASEWNVENIGGTVYLLSGRTNPGVMVRSQGRETNSGPDGAFKMQISTPSIETAVEISDDRGNQTGFIISLRNGSVMRRY